jgi:hypothetical protein
MPKRTSDVQINKDDYDADEPDDVSPGEIKQGFQKASDDVLAKRKIVRARLVYYNQIKSNQIDLLFQPTATTNF